MALSPQELSDRTEIMDTLIRYAQAIDTKEFGLLADVFTPDAQVDACRVQGFEHGELFGDDERSVIGQHDTA